VDAKRMRIVVTALLGLGVALGISAGLHGLGGVEDPAHGGSVEYELFEVPPDDLAGHREWAEARCKGLDIESLAAELGVEPTLDDVLGRVGRSLPPPSRAVVQEACEKELAKTERARDVAS
jgi:hypothetical protein